MEQQTKIKQEQRWWDSPPGQLTFDELLSGAYGKECGYTERYGRWQIVLESGWYYTGDIGQETARRCDYLNRLDWMTL